MKLFDFIKVIFAQDNEYENLTRYNRSKNRFMTTRFFSIQFPTTAHLLNRNGLDPVAVNDSWRLIALNLKSKRVPGWIYTKTKKVVDKENKDFQPREETIKFYLNRNRLSTKDFKDCMKFNKDGLLNELEKLEKEITDKDKE